MNTKVHFSSVSNEWETPKEFFKKYDDIYNFDIDVCANELNHLCKKYYSESNSALEKDWIGNCWMNPPYGREIAKWMAKAETAGRSGVVVVCLIPARTDTAWWHDYAMKGKVFLIRCRLKFGNAKQCAPFPSAVVVFGPNTDAEK